MTVIATPEFRSIPLTLIFFSNTNSQELRREQIDKAALNELAESIKSVGVAQPILVRPLREKIINDGHAYELVAGERRVRAAKIAGLLEIPSTIRELTDAQVVELQLVENLQRQDIHELAEAEGYEQLLGLGFDVDAIAAKVGKSRGTVYARMKLLSLLPEARKAFYQGKMPASVALLLARIPVPELQKKALKEVTEARGYGEEKGPMSVRAATRHIHETYMLRLSDAGFKTNDATLIPSAGACGECPKRTGNQPELFGDVKGADVCTDPVCFKLKIQAHGERVLAQACATGQTVLTGADAKKVAKYGVDSSSLEGYVRLDKRDWNSKGTYRQTLGKGYQATLLQDPDTGKMIEVAPNKDVEKARGNKPGRKENDSGRARERAEQKKRDFEIAYRRALFLAIYSKKPDEERPTLHAACIEFFKSLSADTQQLVAKALGWDAKNTKGAQGNYSRHIEPKPFIDPMTLPELYKLLRGLTLAGELSYFTYGSKGTPCMDAAAKACGISTAKVRNELKAAEQTKLIAKKPAKVSATKKPRAKK
jgi:ParB/RepB/Spo0J family partition protein